MSVSQVKVFLSDIVGSIYEICQNGEVLASHAGVRAGISLVLLSVDEPSTGSVAAMPLVAGTVLIGAVLIAGASPVDDTVVTGALG